MAYHDTKCFILILALVCQTVQGTPTIVDDPEGNLCIPGFDLNNRIADWELTAGLDTYVLEDSCRVIIEELRRSVIGKHGPPSIYDIKSTMCQLDCVTFSKNVNLLRSSTECPCEVLDQEYPLPSNAHSQITSWCDRTPAFYLGKILDYHVNQEEFDKNYCPCETALYCASVRATISSALVGLSVLLHVAFLA